MLLFESIVMSTVRSEGLESDVGYGEFITQARSSLENLDLELESLPIWENLVLVTDFSYSLADTGKSLEGSKNRSTISLMAAEEEINQLKKQ